MFAALPRRARLLALAMFSAWTAGCGAKVVPPAFEEDDPRAFGGREQAVAAPERATAAADAPPAPVERERPIAPPGAGRRAGRIDRAALLRVLDAGPGSLLRTVEVSPFFEGSRFLGWRLDQIVDTSSPVVGIDLAVGDIILAVNQRPLARPEHVMAIWQELRSADTLICQVWRGGGAFTLRFAISPTLSGAAAGVATR